MPIRQRTLMVEFNQKHKARLVFVRKDTNPQRIASLLNLDPLPRGVISISGGAKKFPRQIIKQTIRLAEEVIAPLAFEENLLVVDGGTESGVMKIVGKAFEKARYRHAIIIGDSCQNPLLGVVPERKVAYPGTRRSAQTYVPLDQNHFYFVMVMDASHWGEEVACMFSFLDYLTGQKRVPVVNLIANGGRITIKEAFHTVQQRQHLIVLEGSKRATEAILAALDGASEDALTQLLRKRKIVQNNRELQETLHWLNSIAMYDKITRFNFLSQPLKDLRAGILSKLGLDKPHCRRVRK